MKIHRDTLANVTDEQLLALRDNVLQKWEHIPNDGISIWTEFGTLMVSLEYEGRSTFVLGIEKDGYTHS